MGVIVDFEGVDCWLVDVLVSELSVILDWFCVESGVM